MLTVFQYEGFDPHSSTGNFPHGQIQHVRDNAHMSDLADRIQQRLDALGLKPNAASEKAGLERGYIKDLFARARAGKIRNPRADTLKKLSFAVECDIRWLATGQGSPTIDGNDQRSKLKALADEIADGDLDSALTIFEALREKARSRRRTG